MDNTQREAIVAAVRARMQSFEAAERARDAERLLAHNAPPPDFQIYHDGRPGTYAALQAAVRGGLPALRSLDVTYAELQISVLSAEYALLGATFRREMVIAASGAVNVSEGAVSYLWRNIDGQWLIVHGHISHPLKPGA
jgi:ketosteroid isomerase-like protein